MVTKVSLFMMNHYPFLCRPKKRTQKKGHPSGKSDKCLHEITFQKVIFKLLNFGPANCGTSLVPAISCGGFINSQRSGSINPYSHRKLFHSAALSGILQKDKNFKDTITGNSLHSEYSVAKCPQLKRHFYANGEN